MHETTPNARYARFPPRGRVSGFGRPGATDVKTALITDIHANREALEAVLAHAHGNGATALAFLGDFVGYGADPAAVVTLVRERVAAGDTDAEIRAFFRERYGDFVLFRPPWDARTWALWMAPGLLFALGVWAIRRRATSGGETLAPEEGER